MDREKLWFCLGFCSGTGKQERGQNIKVIIPWGISQVTVHNHAEKVTDLYTA